MNQQYNKDRFDIMSFLGYVTKTIQSRGPRHGPWMRQVLFRKARNMLRKAKSAKNSRCQTILERWDTDVKYRRGFVWTRMDRRTNQTIRRTCIGRRFPWSYTWRMATMGEELAHCFTQGSNSRSHLATPWFLWSEANVSSTVLRTCWKYRRRK